MKVAILLNRPRPRLRTAGKQMLTTGYELLRRPRTALASTILPEFDSFATLLDPNPVVLGTEDAFDPAVVAGCDLLIWEWGWTAAPAERALEIYARTGIPLLTFPGPVDRFFREMAPADLECHFAAARACDWVGVMLSDLVGFYRALAPAAHVFHLPVPVAVDRFRALAVPACMRSTTRVLLSAPTRVCGPASQLPITSHLVFRELRREFPQLEGLCFAYDDEEARQAQQLVHELGTAAHVRIERFVRPLPRFRERVRHCALWLAMPHALIQGRLALLGACLGVPVVASDDVETHRHLYPQTTVPWHDIDGAVQHATRILRDPAFAVAVTEHAAQAVDAYSVADVTARLRTALASRQPARRSA